MQWSRVTYTSHRTSKYQQHIICNRAGGVRTSFDAMLDSQKSPAQAQITCHVCKSRAHTSSCTFSISCLPSRQAVCPPNTNRTDSYRATWQPPRGAGPLPPPPLLLHVHVCSSVSYSHTSLKYLHQQHLSGRLHNSKKCKQCSMQQVRT